jgi:polyferredoxin
VARQRTPALVWLRRLSQTAFFALFVWLFLQTVYHPINTLGGHWVTLFFDFDPLVLLTVWLSGHAVAGGLLLGLVTAAGTVLLGRLFCGWVCPLGAVHTLFSSQRAARAKQKISVGGYSSWQRAKYGVLAVALGSALFGLNLVGWLDPFSLLFRSMATSVYPTASAGTQSFFGWIYDANPGIGPARVTAASEPIYEVLRRHVLPVEQPYYVGGFLIGALFVGIVALNLYRARFWCRYVCPLGALLGVAGKNPLIRVSRDLERCNDCRLCRTDCQGGADPDGDWRPSECLYCWNCVDACPTQGIRIGFALPPRTTPEKKP